MSNENAVLDPLCLAILQRNYAQAKLLLDSGTDPQVLRLLNITNNGTVFHLAVGYNDIPLCKFLIEQKISDINQVCENGFTPLDVLLIFKSDQKEMIDLLLDNGAEIQKAVTHPFQNKGNVLHHTILNNCCDVKLLTFLKDKTDINKRDGMEFTPFMTAVLNENMEVAWELIRLNADTSITQHDFTIFHLLKIPDAKFIELFISKKIDINAESVHIVNECAFFYTKLSPNFSHITPVLRAFLLKRIELAELFIKYGAHTNDIRNYVSPKTGNTMLHDYAEEEEDTIQLDFILRHHLIDLDSTNKLSFTPLMQALYYNDDNQDPADKLLDVTVNIDHLYAWKNKHNENFILYLARQACWRAISQLDSKNLLHLEKIDLSATSYTGDTLLSHAVLNDAFDIADKLIAAGADIEFLRTWINDQNKDILDMLSSTNSFDAIRYLHKIGFFSSNLKKPKKKNYTEFTPLMYAIASSQFDVANILINAGADLSSLHMHVDDNNIAGEPYSFLHHLIKRINNINIFDYLLTKKYISPEQIDYIDRKWQKDNLYTPLMFAIASNQFEIADILIEMGAKKESLMNWENSEMENFLHFLAKNDKNMDALEYLERIECLPNISKENCHHKTPRDIAIKYGAQNIETWFKNKEELKMKNKPQASSTTMSNKNSKTKGRRKHHFSKNTSSTPVPLTPVVVSKNEDLRKSKPIINKKSTLIENCNKLTMNIDLLNKKILTAKDEANTHAVLNQDIIKSFDTVQKSLNNLLKEDLAKLQADINQLDTTKNNSDAEQQLMNDKIAGLTERYLIINMHYLNADNTTTKITETYKKRKQEYEKSQNSSYGTHDKQYLKNLKQHKPKNKKYSTTASVQQTTDIEENESENEEESFFNSGTISSPRNYSPPLSMSSHQIYKIAPEKAYTTTPRSKKMNKTSNDQILVEGESSHSSAEPIDTLDNQLSNICKSLETFKKIIEDEQKGDSCQIHNLFKLNELILIVNNLEIHYAKVTSIAGIINITIPPIFNQILKPDNLILKNFIDLLNPQKTNINTPRAYQEHLSNINLCISGCKQWKETLAKPISNSPAVIMYSPAKNNSNTSETLVNNHVNAMKN